MQWSIFVETWGFTSGKIQLLLTLVLAGLLLIFPSLLAHFLLVHMLWHRIQEKLLCGGNRIGKFNITVKAVTENSLNCLKIIAEIHIRIC